MSQPGQPSGDDFFDKPPQPVGGAQPAYPAPRGDGSIGKVRSTGISILLYIVTLGIYGFVWWFKVHAEMKRHRGEGLGGGLAVVISIIISPVMAYITANEVQKLYEARGQEPPVRTTTGLWYFPGSFIIVGPIVWFVKVNGALNDYWRSVGAQG